ncbi:hypothetical protein VPH35_084044 [Triticum aestivum]
MVVVVDGEMRRRRLQGATWRHCASAWKRTRVMAPSARLTLTPSDPHVLSAPPTPPTTVPPYKRRPETLVSLLGWFYKKPCGIIRMRCDCANAHVQDRIIRT